MPNQELENLFNELTRIHSNFLYTYPHYTNGKNKKIRKQSEEDVRNLIERAVYLIKSNDLLFDIYKGGHSSPQSFAFSNDEFLQPRWFGRDLGRLLEKIQKKLSTM